MAKKEFIEDDELVVIANKVIDDHKLELNGVKIKYVLVVPNITKTVVGKCIRPNAELKYFGEFDYLVEFSDDIWQAMTPEDREILMLHELKHIFVTDDDEGKTHFKIMDHDVKDFMYIINKFGIDWHSRLRHTAASLHDFQHGEVDKIKL